MRKLAFVSLVVVVSAAVSAQTQLYGVGVAGNQFAFTQINTTTGAAATLFNFTVPGSRIVQGLTYIPSTNRFITVAQSAANPANLASLVEINPVSQTATVVAHGIPAPFFEGIEYSSTLNRLVVSYGPGGFFSGSLAFLNPATYALQSLNAGTGLPDGDILFEDGNGDLNVVDDNTAADRNRINTPLGPGTTLTPIGGNTFFTSAGTVYDFAWKADENRLFGTRLNQLQDVNPLTNALTPVGASYGIPVEMRGLAVASQPVPEPATLALGAAGLAAAVRRRRARRG